MLKLRCSGRMVAAACSLSLALSLPASAGAQVRLSQEEALRLAFPEPAAIDRRTAFLTDEQLQRAAELAGADVSVEDAVVTYYVGKNGQEELGVAYFDAHTVRTLPEVLMIVVTPDDRVGRIEILKFLEPPEYKASEGWLGQFLGRGLSTDLSEKGSIINMTGATLTSRAISRAVRRVLALHEVIGPLAAADGAGEQ